MLIIIKKKNDNSIQLDAYSYAEAEFQEVRDFFKEFGLMFNEENIDRDRLSRRGYRFLVDKINSWKLEKILNLSFTDDGQPEFTYTGIPYRCKELTRNGNGSGCENILAESHSRARIICSAAIARREGWFSSYPEEGKCARGGWIKSAFGWKKPT